MSTIPATVIDRRAATKRARVLSRLFMACVDEIVRYLACRAAIKSLRELDDYALKDIGLLRCQIEPVVRGSIRRPERRG